ncbi:MAG TPA: hypothetical protein VI612_05020 [Candidatus Nanoarchaeia archaeon]|nr:hypothetical protein [Candidatus Nanoarchaeia archaeon]
MSDIVGKISRTDVDAELIYGDLISFCLETFVNIYQYKDLTAEISDADRTDILDVILVTKLDIENGIVAGRRMKTLSRDIERILNDFRGRLIALSAAVSTSAVRTYQDFRNFVHFSFIDPLIEELGRTAPIAAVKLQDLSRS